MCAEISHSDSLKKAVRKHEKKLRQILHLKEQSSARKLTKEEVEKVAKGSRNLNSFHIIPVMFVKFYSQVQSKENVQKELNELKTMVESVEFGHSSGEGHIIGSLYIVCCKQSRPQIKLLKIMVKAWRTQ